jgi:RNA polymerase sigma-54 factor
MIRTPRLGLRQHLTPSLTAQRHQAIMMLQFSRLELADYLRDAIEQNPFLQDTEEEPNKAVFPYAELDLAAQQRGKADRQSQDEARLEQRAATLSLREHIQRQIALDFRNPEDSLVAMQLLDGLDDAGYLIVDLEEIAGRLSCPLDRINTVLRCLQQMEPAGIFARSLRECLALQLADRNRIDPLMEKLLDHLDLVAAGKISLLQKICQVDQDEIVDMIHELRALNPKPGLSFAAESVQQISPDLLLRANGNNEWRVDLVGEASPSLRIDAKAYRHLRAQVRQPTDQKYIAGRWQEAAWLVRSLRQRAETLLKVGNEIARQQADFFTFGINHFRPLGLRHIADAIGVHESTVSRATAGKYMATPRGLYELKYFFSQKVLLATKSPDVSLPDTTSAKVIQHRIKVLIQGEAPGAILSDDNIVALLRAEGVDIARRTVAKYRDYMKIPSSALRRRQKALSIVLHG